MKSSKCKIDQQRTKELNIPELLVMSGKGDQDHFFCVLVSSKAHLGCPHCGNSAVRNQGNIHRDYLDIIRRDDDAALVIVSLEFRKNKCVSPGCGCVYYPEFSFASPYARTTRRLEDVIVRMVLRGGCSYAEISEELKGKLSRQVVGQIFRRRVKQLNSDRSDAAAWYRELLEEGPDLFYRGVINREHRLPYSKVHQRPLNNKLDLDSK